MANNVQLNLPFETLNFTLYYPFSIRYTIAFAFTLAFFPNTPGAAFRLFTHQIFDYSQLVKTRFFSINRKFYYL